MDGFPLHVALSATSEAVSDVHVSVKYVRGTARCCALCAGV